MSTAQQLLAACPDFLSIDLMLKAELATEGEKRFVYIEASNEAMDQQGEVVLQKALRDSSDWYSRFGNLDIDHYSLIGAKAGIPDYMLFEIGQPREVSFHGVKTFVKGEIYSGQGPAAERANYFWSSLTDINPPARWKPSVGGAVLEKSIAVDPETGMKKAMIGKVRWTNIGFSKNPVNQDVPMVSTVPFDTLAKSWVPGLGYDLSKALDSTGATTNTASLTGGAALGRQSLDRKARGYWDFRDAFAGDLGEDHRRFKTHADMVRHAAHKYGLDDDLASEFVERFMHDWKTAREKRQ
ncbi:hypothetical protein [Methylomagnum ishizawai]|uniref:hypothetical protein n=1 Tax=Methylomagnum ishizawai TaxID=1760988 RepID=UPI001C7F1C33|nr:hypothetical protein [Methylomagnum ishizawai]